MIPCTCWTATYSGFVHKVYVYATFFDGVFNFGGLISPDFLTFPTSSKFSIMFRIAKWFPTIAFWTTPKLLLSLFPFRWTFCTLFAPDCDLNCSNSPLAGYCAQLTRVEFESVSIRETSCVSTFVWGMTRCVSSQNPQDFDTHMSSIINSVELACIGLLKNFSLIQGMSVLHVFIK